MFEDIEICEKGKSICVFSSREMAEDIGFVPDSGEGGKLKEEYESIVQYLRDNSKEQGKIVIDLNELLKGKNLDAVRTTAVFWLSSAMKRKNALKKLSPGTAMKLIPHIAAKTKAAELDLKNTAGLENLLKFTRTCTDSINRVAQDEITADEAAQKIYEVLPDENTVRNEIKVRPAIINVLRSVKELGETCSDPDIRQKIGDYFDKLSDVM